VLEAYRNSHSIRKGWNDGRLMKIVLESAKGAKVGPPSLSEETNATQGAAEGSSYVDWQCTMCSYADNSPSQIVCSVCHEKGMVVH
jgi:hypothetical protein